MHKITCPFTKEEGNFKMRQNKHFISNAWCHVQCHARCHVGCNNRYYVCKSSCRLSCRLMLMSNGVSCWMSGHIPVKPDFMLNIRKTYLANCKGPYASLETYMDLIEKSHISSVNLVT